MQAAAMKIDMHIPAAHSLKDKRATLKPIVEAVRHRYNCASAEVEHQDLWQRSAVGVAVVSTNAGHVTDMLDEIERFVWSFPEIEVVDVRRAWLEME
jgi:uncharacterized protein YlxP (DUF503 family)